MLRKLFIIGLIFLGIVAATPVFGQTPPPNLEVAKEFNPLCWQRKVCEAKRTELSRGEPPSGEGFITGSEAGICRGGEKGAEDEWGRCLPSNVAKTEIAFGGKTEFANIGEFLTNGYKLALGTASILAAIMIVVAGFQWTASGGNATIITTAKNRIAGAVIGLFIAYTSYVILYTINPNLVNLHLPQTWLLRPQAEIPEFCSAIPFPMDPYSKTFHKVFPNTDQTSPVTTTKSVSYEMSYKDVIDGLAESGGQAGQNCGYRFLSKDSGNFACFGNGCGSGQSCVNFHMNDLTDTKYLCEAGSVFGSISNSKLTPTGGVVLNCISSQLFGDTSPSYPYVERGNPGIAVICTDKKSPLGYSREENIIGQGLDVVRDDENLKQYFKFVISEAPDCADGSVPLGYAIRFDLSVNCSWSGSFAFFDKYGAVIGYEKKIGLFDLSNTIGIIRGWLNGKYDYQPVNTPTKESLISKEDLKRGITVHIDVSSVKVK